MAAIGTVISVALTLFAALDNEVLKEITTSLRYKSQLESLKSTVETVQSVLLDAAASEELTHAARDYIEKLKAAVCDADDLFDEFRTLAERKQHKIKEGNHLHLLFEKVRIVLSSDNPLNVAHKMSREIKKVRKNLDGIARDHTNFGFTVDSRRIRNRRQETCSYVNAPNVIGREVDVESIVDKLLDLNGKKGARYLAVVGMGGMGKTSLAQLVCADQRVKNGFYSNVWWVCVADEENSPFDMKTILSKMLESVTGTNPHRDSSLEVVQKKLGQELEGKKYLLVLDDVWNEDRVKWMELTDFLTLGAAESRILVTTRTHDVANAIGNSDIHELMGLSDENSWRLFEATAFEQKPDSQVNALEVEIGKKIVQQCFNVPLALKVVGSLLCGQGLDKWRTFKKSGLRGIGKGDNPIMSILKLSYHNLEPSLKSCFTYCALFPKKYRMKKEMLIRLWIAQGYIIPFDRGQSIEEAGDEHFLILLQRCFFQDVKIDEHGVVESFKMHDLIHDLAQEVAGQEILVTKPETSNLADKVRHVFQGSSVCDEKFYSNINVKVCSYLRVEPRVDMQLPVDRIFTNGGCLRTLTLENADIMSLPDSIGKLVHLRYLDLSRNYELETLPGSLTKLHNLQTLKLEWCNELRELPKKLSRLVNLMYLNIHYCDNIKYMPVGMDKLTSLCELTDFVVADESSSGEKRVGQLKDLKAIVGKLKGRIHIKIPATVSRAIVNDWEGSLFESTERLQGVSISGSDDEAYLEKLLPHRNVNKLKLSSYMDVRFPRWGRADYNWAALLPNLVTIEISDCSRLKHLPLLSKLKHVRSLTLDELDELEYIDSSCPAESTRFPSLEFLVILNAPKLKGWWAGVEFGDISNNALLWQQSFPRLCILMINCCRDFIMCRSWEHSLVEFEVCFPAGRLTDVVLEDKEVESLAEVGDVFNICCSLQRLRLYYCSKLVNCSGGLKHLTTLESLEIGSCWELKWEEGDDDEGMPWSKLHHNLRNLGLYGIQNLEVLPSAQRDTISDLP